MILVAGPCVIESYAILQQTVEELLQIAEPHNFFFKSSWRKDNRTDTTKFLGLDPDEAIELLLRIKREYNVKICTDIHNPSDLTRYPLGRVDLIQIPAFLAKQQSMLKTAAIHCKMYNTALHIKKPQFIAAEDMRNIYNIAWTHGAERIILTDRGTMYGSDKLFMDPRHVTIMKSTGAEVLCDITHPNKGYSGWNVDNAITLGKSYLAAEADGIFLETHPDCENALCDADTQIPLSEVKNVIGEINDMVF